MSDNDKTPHRFAIKVEYIGKNYAGSQIQPDRNTIQSELEKALSTLIGKFSLTPENSKETRQYCRVPPFHVAGGGSVARLPFRYR